jgi:hypothetical protein
MSSEPSADGGRYNRSRTPERGVLILLLLGACLIPPSALYARAIYSARTRRIRLL